MKRVLFRPQAARNWKSYRTATGTRWRRRSSGLAKPAGDRAASRILGMGDVLSFIEKAEEVIDKKQAVEMQRKLIDNEFTLEDFRDQMKQLRKLGPLENVLSMMPQVGILKDLKNVKVDEKEITH